MAEPSKISLYIKNDLKRALKIKAAQDGISISEVARHYLKNWHLSLMGFVDYEDRSSLPEISGIYFVVSDDSIRYIGRSVNLKTRFQSHHKRETFQCLNSPVIQWIAVDTAEIDELEKILITTIRPEINNYLYDKDKEGKTKLVKIHQEDYKFLTQIKDNLSATWGRQASFADAMRWLVKSQKVREEATSEN